LIAKVSGGFDEFFTTSINETKGRKRGGGRNADLLTIKSLGNLAPAALETTKKGRGSSPSLFNRLG